MSLKSELACGNCGGTTFKSIDAGTFTEEHYYASAEPSEQWTEDQETSTEDTGNINCLNCGQYADGDLFEALVELDWR